MRICSNCARNYCFGILGIFRVVSETSPAELLSQTNWKNSSLNVHNEKVFFSTISLEDLSIISWKIASMVSYQVPVFTLFNENVRPPTFYFHFFCRLFILCNAVKHVMHHRVVVKNLNG